VRPNWLPGVGTLPAEDRRLSPYSGWSRAHWEAVADALLHGARASASRRHALVLPPGGRRSSRGRRSDGLEGFARSFLLASYRLAGGGGGVPDDLAEWYATGLAAGTDRRGRESWPTADRVRQAVVEAAFLALALAESRPWVWDTLPSSTQTGIVAWLTRVHGVPVPDNNWVLFPVAVNTFLKSIGASHRQDEIDRGLDAVDSWYRGNGWYSDGPRRSYDYYVGWALHFHLLMWCRLDGDHSDPGRAATYRARLRRYLEDYPYLFAADGAPLYHGRSLTYRFAVAAPLWMGALCGATPLPAGETRRIASGALRNFVERGAISEDGTLTLGWHREFLPMLQHYSGHGSPYWASKAFLGLLLPPTHPVWIDREEPAPVERDDFCIAMPEPGFVVRGTRADGIVRVASHRSDHYPLYPGRRRWTRALIGRVARRLGLARRSRITLRDDAHYRKLAYSTHTAPDTGPSADPLDVDSQLALVRADGTVSRRALIHPIAVADRFAASFFLPQEPGAGERVETVAIARGAAEIRVHHVITPGGSTPRDGGFAVADPEPPYAQTGEGWALVRAGSGLVSYLAGLHGFSRAGVARFEGTNAFGRHSASPFLESAETVEGEAVYVSLVVLTRDELDPETVRAGIAVHVDGRVVEITVDGGERFLVQLVSPAPVERTLGSLPLHGRVRFARSSPNGSSFTLAADGLTG
jgi:hypothetical protein